MGLTLDIGKMVRARQWLWGGVLIVLLVAWIEIVLTIAVAIELEAGSLVFLVLAVAVLIAQFRILGITRSAFARVSKELWRTYAFITLALVFFIGASMAIGDAILPLYFTVLSIIFILGDTDNLFWEFSTTIGKRGKDALLVVVPSLRKQTDLNRNT